MHIESGLCAEHIFSFLTQTHIELLKDFFEFDGTLTRYCSVTEKSVDICSFEYIVAPFSRPIWIPSVLQLGCRLKHLDISGIYTDVSLDCLKDCPLTFLDLSESLISDLSSLAKCPLQTLNIPNSRVKNLDALQSMPLTRLDLHWNIHIACLEPIKNCPITYLDLYNAPSIRELPQFSCLTYLDLSSNLKIKSIEPLSKCPLMFLSLMVNHEISSLKGLENCPIEFLDLSSNDKIDTLEPLSACTTLRYLNLQNTELIKSVQSLQNCSQLTFLDLSRCEIADLSPLRHSTELFTKENVLLLKKNT